MPLISSTISQSPELQHNRKEMYAGEELASNRVEAIPPVLNEQIVETNQALPDKSIAFDKLQMDKIKPNQNIGSENFVTGSAGWIIRGDGTAEFNGGGVSVSELHIPDEDTTDDSMHVDSDGNTWWGCTSTDFTADNDNALAYILKTGAAKFQSATVNGRTFGADPVFGDGSDGDVTIAAGTTTLARDMFYDNLTVNGTLKTNGWRVFCKTSCAIGPGGNITVSGNNGGTGGMGGIDAAGTAGSGGVVAHTAGSLPAPIAGVAGGVGGSSPAPGTAGTATTASATNQAGAAGGKGGSGADGAGQAGGAAGAVTSAAMSSLRTLVNASTFVDSGSNTGARYGGSGGSGGGGGGGGQPAASAYGAGGGGSGSNGGYMLIASPSITVGSGTITANGGNGGAGGSSTSVAGGGGGGGGGQGGIIVLIYTSLDSDTNITVTGGTGGAAGAQVYGGPAPEPGANGANGLLVKLQLI